MNSIIRRGAAAAGVALAATMGLGVASAHAGPGKVVQIVDDTGAPTGCTIASALTYKAGDSKVKARGQLTCSTFVPNRFALFEVTNLTTGEVVLSLANFDSNSINSGILGNLPCTPGTQTWLVTSKAVVVPNGLGTDPRFSGVSERRLTFTCA